MSFLEASSWKSGKCLSEVAWVELTLEEREQTVLLRSFLALALKTACPTFQGLISDKQYIFHFCLEELETDRYLERKKRQENVEG